MFQLEGKKIGVLPSAAQDTLFLENLNKGWSVDDFNKVFRQVNLYISVFFNCASSLYNKSITVVCGV